MADEEKRTVLPLSFPVVFGSEEIKELRIRPATAGDMDDMSADLKLGDFRRLLGRLSGQNEGVTSKLHPSDFFAAVEILNSFLQIGPTTGAKPSGS